MLHIIIDSYIPYIKGALDDIANVEYLSAEEMTNERIRHADALIVRTRTRCNKQLLENTNVRFIASATIGYDHIDGRYCDENGIKWTNAPGCNSLAVAQYVASALSVLQQKQNIALEKQTIGIVGVGSVGSKIEKLARALGMNVLLNDPPRARKEGNINFCTLDQICQQADIITFHTWLDRDSRDRTYHLADQEFFSKLQRKPYIINSARGEVVSTHALAHALDIGQVAGAIIDCWENEPHIDKKLLAQCIISTPHIAGYSADGKANAATQSVAAVSRFFELGIDEWKAILDTEAKPLEREFKDVIDFFLHTYDICEDSKKLQQAPTAFEQQRSEYTFRREPKAYPQYIPKGFDFFNC